MTGDREYRRKGRLQTKIRLTEKLGGNIELAIKQLAESKREK